MVHQGLVKRILQQYGFVATNVLPMQTGYRSEVYPVQLVDGKLANLILFKREPGIVRRIKNANRVGDYLAAQGLPARRTLNPRLIRLHSATREVYGALYNCLPGQTIPWEAYTMNHIKQLGATLEQLHASLQPLQREELPPVAADCVALNQRMQQYFQQPGVRRALQQKLSLGVPQSFKNHEATLRILAKSTAQQALHMDFVRGNILFEGGTSIISGILDFEKTAWGDPLFDVARSLAFLLVDCKYKTTDKTRKYFLQSGYIKRGQGVISEPEVLEKLVSFFLVHDFYKFLLHNPYEYLPQNEHFVRTRDLLLERSVIQKLPKNAKIVLSS